MLLYIRASKTIEEEPSGCQAGERVNRVEKADCLNFTITVYNMLAILI